MRPRPCAMSHVALTVPDLDAAVQWYRDLFGFDCIAGPYELVAEGRPQDEGAADAFGRSFGSVHMAHLSCANGVGLELFQFDQPGTVKPKENFRYWEVGYSHICLIDPDVEGLVGRIVEAGGRLRTTKVRPVFPDSDYRWVYCEDPFGNVIEITSHAHEQVYSNMEV